MCLRSETPKHELGKSELIEKKRKLKEKFDAEYDNNDEKDGSYYHELKQDATKQAEVSSASSASK